MGGLIGRHFGFCKRLSRLRRSACADCGNRQGRAPAPQSSSLSSGVDGLSSSSSFRAGPAGMT